MDLLGSCIKGTEIAARTLDMAGDQADRETRGRLDRVLALIQQARRELLA